MIRLAAAVLLLLLPASPAGAAMIFDPESGCATSNPFPRPGESVRWSGGCRDGLLDGYGTLVWLENGVEYERDVGTFRAGELHGEAVISFAGGGRIQGTYRNGARDGEFVIERPDGSIVRALYDKGLFISERPMNAAEAAAWRAGVPPPPPPMPVAVPAPQPAPPVPEAAPAAAPAPPAVAYEAPERQPAAAASAPAVRVAPAPRLRLEAPPGEKLGAIPLQPRSVALAPPAAGRVVLRPPAEPPVGPPDGRSVAPMSVGPAPAAPSPAPTTAAPAPTPATAPQRPSPSTDRYAVSLTDASIRDAAETVLAGILNRRYVVEPGVAGSVSIAAENFVDSAALLSAFRRELLRNGADLVDQNGVLRIVATRVAPPAPASALGRRGCTRPELYDGGAQWCGVVRGEGAETYDVEVESVSPNSAFASGLAASPCTGHAFLSRFERGKRIVAPKGCFDLEG